MAKRNPIFFLIPIVILDVLLLGVNREANSVFYISLFMLNVAYFSMRFRSKIEDPMTGLLFGYAISYLGIYWTLVELAITLILLSNRVSGFFEHHMILFLAIQAVITLGFTAMIVSMSRYESAVALDSEQIRSSRSFVQITSDDLMRLSGKISDSELSAEVEKLRERVLYGPMDYAGSASGIETYVETVIQEALVDPTDNSAMRDALNRLNNLIEQRESILRRE